MFFGNLSTASELKERSKIDTKNEDASSKNDVENSSQIDALLGNKLESLAIMTDELMEPEGEILYYDSRLPLPPGSTISARFVQKGGKDGTIPRDVIIDYFGTCAKMILLEKNQRLMLKEHYTTGKPLPQCNMDYQRDVLEYNFKIERNFGVRYLASIPSIYPDDKELFIPAKRFMFTCLKCYLEVVRMRNEDRKARGTPLQTEGDIKKSVFLEFFEGCNALMAMPEVKDTLRALYRETKEPPASQLMQYQREILELLGVDADYGVKKMQAFVSANPSDREVTMKMQQYTMCAQIAIQESTMTDEQREAFYSNIPEFMHHFPHIHMMQQQHMRMQQQQQQQQQQQHQHQHQHQQQQQSGNSNTNMNTQQEQVRAAMEQIMSSPEGRNKLTQLTTRMGKLKPLVENEVNALSPTEMLDYFDQFGADPILASFGNVRIDSLERIQAFLDMDENSLVKVMKMQMILQQDAIHGDGSLNKMLMDKMKAKESATSTTTSSSASSSYVNDHDHSHSHSHSHDGGESSCSHPEHTSKVPSTSSSSSSHMDR